MNNQPYREPPSEHQNIRFNRDHFLPMGESLADFSSTTRFFESKIPEDIRVAILRLFSNIGGRPTAQYDISKITPLLLEKDFTNTEIVVKYMEYLISFLYINTVVHAELVRVNRLKLDTDAASIAQSFRAAGVPEYLTTERVFEWYICYSQKSTVRIHAIFIREDEFGNSLVNIPPSLWSKCFITPRLDRLLQTHTESY